MLSTFEKVELLRFLGILYASVNGSNGRLVSNDVKRIAM